MTKTLSWKTETKKFLFKHNFFSNNNNSSDKSQTQNGQKKDKDPTSPIQDGKFNNRYKVVKTIGKGRFGLVHLVIDEIYNIQMDEAFYENEYSILGKLDNPNIVKYYDNIELEPTKHLAVVTEYCQNGDLQQRILNAKFENESFTEKQILEWTLQACNGLRYLHSKRIIHRSVKPSNLFLAENDVVKLGDFVLAKLTGRDCTHVYAISHAYMSPEQYRCLFLSGKYSYNADIWSLACVLYELIFLKLAFPIGQKCNPSIPKLDEKLAITPIHKRMFTKDPLVRINSNELYEQLNGLRQQIEEECTKQQEHQ